MLIRDGLARAKARGKSGGRPKIDGATEAVIRSALRKGDAGIHKIAAAFGVGTGYGAADQGGEIADYPPFS
jgi:hypothetical protein